MMILMTPNRQIPATKHPHAPRSREFKAFLGPKKGHRQCQGPRRNYFIYILVHEFGKPLQCCLKKHEPCSHERFSFDVVSHPLAFNVHKALNERNQSRHDQNPYGSV